jgi:hypothetical protein
MNKKVNANAPLLLLIADGNLAGMNEGMVVSFNAVLQGELDGAKFAWELARWSFRSRAEEPEVHENERFLRQLTGVDSPGKCRFKKWKNTHQFKMDC